MNPSRLLPLFALSVASVAFAHSGGLNAEGCHFNRKTGDYHCHRAAYSSPASSAPVQGLVGAVPHPRTDSRGYGVSPGGGSSCASEVAEVRTSCQTQRRADRDKIADLEQQVRSLSDELRSARADVRRLQRERQGYFP